MCGGVGLAATWACVEVVMSLTGWGIAVRRKFTPFLRLGDSWKYPRSVKLCGSWCVWVRGNWHRNLSRRLERVSYSTGGFVYIE